MATTEKNGTMKYKDGAGNVTAMYPKTKMSQVEGLSNALAGKAASSHTHSAATTSANGFMSSTDKSKLDGIAAGANKTTVDSALSSSSTNPVQNKVINTALAGKAAASHTHTASQVDGLDGKIADGQKLDIPIAASSNDGVAYTAMVPGLTTLAAGYSFIMVPDVISESTACTLNVNGLGAKTLRIRSTGYTSTTVSPPAANWLGNGKPVRVTYDGMWWVADVVAPESGGIDTSDPSTEGYVKVGNLTISYIKYTIPKIPSEIMIVVKNASSSGNNVELYCNVGDSSDSTDATTIQLITDASGDKWDYSGISFRKSFFAQCYDTPGCGYYGWMEPAISQNSYYKWEWKTFCCLNGSLYARINTSYIGIVELWYKP